MACRAGNGIRVNLGRLISQSFLFLVFHFNLLNAKVHFLNQVEVPTYCSFLSAAPARRRTFSFFVTWIIFTISIVLSDHFYRIEGSRQQFYDLSDVGDILHLEDRLDHALYIRGGDGPRGKRDTVPEFLNEVIVLDGIEVMPVGEIGPLVKVRPWRSVTPTLPGASWLPFFENCSSSNSGAATQRTFSAIRSTSGSRRPSGVKSRKATVPLRAATATLNGMLRLASLVVLGTFPLATSIGLQRSRFISPEKTSIRSICSARRRCSERVQHGVDVGMGERAGGPGLEAEVRPPRIGTLTDRRAPPGRTAR